MSLKKLAFALSLLSLCACTLSAKVDVAAPSTPATASSSPAASASPAVAASTTPVVSASASVVVAGRFKTKEEYVTFLKCAYDGYNNDPELKAKQKASASHVLLGVGIMNEYNASRLLTDTTFVSQKTRIEANGTNYNEFCPAK